MDRKLVEDALRRMNTASARFGGSPDRITMLEPGAVTFLRPGEKPSEGDRRLQEFASGRRPPDADEFLTS